MISSAWSKTVSGTGFTDANLGDLQDDVVEAFQMLDVQRGPDVDAGGEQFVDVLPPLRVAATRNVGVGIFVDQEQAGTPGQRRVQVELPHDLVAIDDRLARQPLEALELPLGLAPAVRLHQAGDDVAAAGFFGLGGGQHGIGLADARSGAQKYLQVPAPFLPGERQQSVRGSALLGVEGHGSP